MDDLRLLSLGPGTMEHYGTGRVDAVAAGPDLCVILYGALGAFGGASISTASAASCFTLISSR
jgi:hypothetical protein